MASANKLFYNRIGHVEIEQPDGGYISYRGLDYKFDVQINGCTYSRFTVGICGLSRESLNNIIIWRSPNAYDNPRHIKVYAGYEDGGESLIAEGGIFSAIPTTPPDVWVNIEACKFLEKRVPAAHEASHEAKFEEILKIVAELFNLDYLDETTSVDKEKKYDFDYSGSIERLPQKLADAFNIVVYEQDGVLIARDKGGEYKSPDEAIPIDTEHGLLAVSSVDYCKVSLTMRLNTIFELFTWVDLKSTRIPQANGKYWVTNIRHTGQLRGEAWQTTITALKHVTVVNK